MLFSDIESGGQRSRRQRLPNAKGEPVSITDRPRILSEQRDYVTDQLSPQSDQEKYALLVNTLDAMATVRWKPSDRTDGSWAKYLAARTYSDKFGKKKLADRFSSTLTVHSPDAARRRIVRWCAWRASWVYSIMLVSEQCGISRSSYFYIT